MTLLADLAKTNAPVSLAGQSVLVTGGTRGIGAGVALRFAQAGAGVVVVGRSLSAGHEILSELQTATKARQGDAQHAFISVDLAEPSAVREVVDRIAQDTKGQGVDHVVLTQGGPPVKAIDPSTSTGLDRSYSVQCLSRFGFAYLLAERDLVRKSITTVMSPGQGSKKPLDADDLDLQKATASGRVWKGIWGTLSRGGRDASVVDAFSETLAERHPKLLISHLFPGGVQSNAIQASGLWGASILSKISAWVAESPAPGGYAEIPFWVSANPAPLPAGGDPRQKGHATLLDQYLRTVPISPNVASPEQRAPIFAALSKFFADPAASRLV